MNGTQSAGSSDYIARADHVHPTDTSRAASNHSHGSLVNDGALNSDITSVNKVAVTDATNKLKTISKLPLDKVTHQDISGKANVNHNHTFATVVNLQSALDSKSETGHTHDDRYYTETEMNTKLNGKANSSHTHTASQISDLTVSTHTLANGAKLYKYGKIVLAVFNNYQYSGKTPNVWTDIFNIPSAYKPISTDNIYGHWSGSTGQIVAGANKIAMYPPQSSGGVFGQFFFISNKENYSFF